jgi:hypothetical protein
VILLDLSQIVYNFSFYLTNQYEVHIGFPSFILSLCWTHCGALTVHSLRCTVVRHKWTVQVQFKVTMYHISFLTVRDVMFRLQIRVVSGSILETEGSLVPRAATIEWRLGGGACVAIGYILLFKYYSRVLFCNLGLRECPCRTI